MLNWLKGFPIGHYVVMAAVAVAVWVYGDLTLTKRALENERDLREQWQNVAETQQAIQQRDTIIIRASEEADRAIMESPNANTLVPPDVASAWAIGIDSVRDAGADDATEHDLLGSSTDSPKRERTNSRAASSVLKGSGSSLPTL